jgi:hypothetical protein
MRVVSLLRSLTATNDDYNRAMQTEMARERETRPAAWVKATLEVANLNEEQVANRVKKRVSTIYNWQKKGIEYLDFIGLLTVVDLLHIDDVKLREQLVAAGLSENDVRKLLEDRADVQAYLKTKPL